MYNKTVELVVGLFMLAGMVALLFLALQVSGLSLDSQKNSYRVYALFDDLGGLSVRGKVSMAGVTIGRVSSVTLEKETYSALVEMEIYSDVDNLTVDSVASIQTSGLLGDKYVAISVGGDEEVLADGDTIFDTQSALNLEKLIGAFASGQADF
ncbi:outer membrane lipid asymmetry maintenance protein MlaD [Oleiphilus sp. HI0071]|jgi:phospholipid/cholesterol/gamma-HCH transport system substrate-binding protein|uniref:outer membrane lipid asymmetry maintenance protein MlaD n=1 Tax=unclassified Oleiphilus TaxID=2631174 RepID=UPI0007C29E63|nr:MULTISPECIES: outer membrane lipid asymmetry maintenance protein MlaD [unclassified Oleiphilus]KZY59166.1 outer membrane lipid asymmetry maintenance protein MlaD [Oleiphilus sp. HI0065]KZY80100.1 outer membrane lipid asymmetry maintenance protein MlaD [Oleiphilus sp. HI0071]KZY96636.1 outer membrane lipid asymmetry maintenance protein MlaD [Oleiphilus sp. HI0073]KZZ40851.1 outer membrane lipid asymmetry maintenance protein MlaD [Oleiphilus sp. HI0118]KZZ49619.1 outer membrane lipid asymmetr